MEHRQQDKQPWQPSLVVCPPTLVGHWPHEITKFVGEGLLTTLQYEGPPAHRQGLRTRADKTADIIVLSYDTLKHDIEWLAGLQWNYCVLDEGHIVRNPKSKIAQVGSSKVHDHMRLRFAAAEFHFC